MYIKIRPLKSRLFEQISVIMDSYSKRLILHTEGSQELRAVWHT